MFLSNKLCMSLNEIMNICVQCNLLYYWIVNFGHIRKAPLRKHRGNRTKEQHKLERENQRAWMHTIRAKRTQEMKMRDNLHAKESQPDPSQFCKL